MSNLTTPTPPPTPELIFVEPPASGRGRPRGQSPIGLWLNALRAHPGQWAKYPEPTTGGRTTAINKGGEYESTARLIPGSKPARHDLYARFIGDT